MMKEKREAPANFVPAAAVIRRGRVFIGMTGREGCLGGGALIGLKPWKNREELGERHTHGSGRGKRKARGSGAMQ